jgi:hypothetical protein
MTILSGVDEWTTQLLAGTSPVGSVYYPRQADEGALRWRSVVRRLVEQGAPPAVVEDLAERVGESGAGPGVLAAYAGDAVAPRAYLLADADLPDLAKYGALPRLTPLLAWQQRHPARVLAVLDRTGADISVYAAGSLEPLDLAVTGPDDEIERNAPGGWSQGRYQHRAEDSWEHNSAAVAEVLHRQMVRAGARILLLAGDVRALQYLQVHLPHRIRAESTIRLLAGGRHHDGSAASLHRQAAEQTERVVGGQLDALLAEFAAAAGTGGAAVEGVEDTLAALAAGRVRVLLLSPGSIPARQAWFGPGPTDVTTRPDLMRPAWLTLREDSVEDVAVRSALLTSAEVRVLPNGPGIGALCRFTA